MGMRDFLDKLKQKAEDRVNPKPLTPEEERAHKQAAAKKKMETLARGIEFIKKAAKTKNDVQDKATAIKDGIAQKTIAIIDKIEGKVGPAPAEDASTEPKNPGVIGKGIAAIKDAGASVVDKAQGIAAEHRKAAACRPSTRSTILDMIVPAVPNTKATAPKKPAATKKPQPPRSRKPQQ